MRVAKRFLMMVSVVALVLLSISPSEVWAQRGDGDRPNPGTLVARIHVHRAANGQMPLPRAEVNVYDYDTHEYFGLFITDKNGDVDLTYGDFHGYPDNRRILLSVWGLDPTGTFYIYHGTGFFQYQGFFRIINVWVFPM